MAGRRPKPTQLRVITGNAGKRPLNEAEPKPRRAIPLCPKHLTGRAQRAWASIGPTLDDMGVLTVADTVALELLCDAYAEWRDARDVVRAEGQSYQTTTQTGGVMHRRRPEVEIAADAWRRVARMLIEFGLTPAARSRVRSDGQEPEEDPADKYFA